MIESRFYFTTKIIKQILLKQFQILLIHYSSIYFFSKLQINFKRFIELGILGQTVKILIIPSINNHNFQQMAFLPFSIELISILFLCSNLKSQKLLHLSVHLIYIPLLQRLINQPMYNNQMLATHRVCLTVYYTNLCSNYFSKIFFVVS